MKALKSKLMPFAVFTLLLVPLPAQTADLDGPIETYAANPLERVVRGLACTVVTIVTLPILILTGEQTDCR